MILPVIIIVIAIFIAALAVSCLLNAETTTKVITAIGIFSFAIVLFCIGLNGIRHPAVSDKRTAVADTTMTVQKRLLKEVDEQINKQLSAERLYNQQRPTSCYADAIDYTDLYAIRDMIVNTTNPDSLSTLHDLLYNTANRLDNETQDLFKADGIQE